jgi:type III secretion system HrpE/YscL family protein
MSRLLRVDADLPPVLLPGTVVKAKELKILLGITEAMEASRAKTSEIQASLDRMSEDARSRGEAAGLEEGRMEAAIHHWKTVLATVSYLRGIQDSIANVVTDSVRKIITELPPRERISGIVTRALQDLVANQSVMISIHPDDESAVIGAVASMKGTLPEGNLEVRLRIDLAPGSCLIETPFGQIDASLEAQLKALAVSLAPSTALSP